MPRPEGIQGNFFIYSDEFDNVLFREFLPFSDLNRWVEENSLISKASKAFKLWGRLQNVRALSFLSYVGPDPEQIYYTGYSHDRLDHSLVVAMTAGEIGKLNNLPSKDIDTLEISGLLHDIATPALGDAAKSIDPENLDEEKFWHEIMDGEGKEFIAQNHVSKGELDGIIKNEGVLGKVLDIADRITYTMKDLHNVIGQVGGKINVDPYLIEIRYPLSHYPQIGNIYKDVAVDQRNGVVFFASHERLGIFLLLRALMHKHLYMEPTSQGRDLFVANLIKPLYAADGSKPLNPRLLRKMTDRELLNVLAKHYQFPRLEGEWLYNQLTNWHPGYERLLTREEAKEKAKEIKRNGFLVIGIKERGGFDAGLSYLTTDEDWKIAPFEKADPVMAHQIRGIEKDTHGVYVFYTDLAGDTPINELLKKAYL